MALPGITVSWQLKVSGRRVPTEAFDCIRGMGALQVYSGCSALLLSAGAVGGFRPLVHSLLSDRR